MSRSYPVGTAEVPLVLTVNDNGPVTGLSIVARIVAPWTGNAFDFSDNTFKPVGSVVTPTIGLTESASSPGVYFALWNTLSIVSDAEAVVLYESTGVTAFVQDEQVLFQSPLFTQVTPFIEPVLDATQRTLTVLTGLRSSDGGLIATTQADLQIKDELGAVLFSKTTTSTNGIHRAVFPNVTIVPNRILLVEIAFTFGASVFNAVDTIKVLGATS